MVTSLPYSRRRVLRTVGAGLFGTAASTLIAACSRNQQTHATSDPSVSQYVRSDFSGEVACESFNTSAGSYVPANAEHPAQNVPVPIKTENMGKNSIAGFYDTIGYLNAALNYLLATGDTNPLEVITINPEFTKALLLFTDETGESQAAKSWYVSPQATLSLTSRMPTAVNDYRKDWRYTLDISLGEQQVVNSQASAIPAEQQKFHYAGTIQGTFEKEAWSLTLTVRDPQSTAGASPS